MTLTVSPWSDFDPDSSTYHCHPLRIKASLSARGQTWLSSFHHQLCHQRNHAYWHLASGLHLCDFMITGPKPRENAVPKQAHIINLGSGHTLNSPSMHHALRIEEILLHIFSYCYTPWHHWPLCPPSQQCWYVNCCLTTLVRMCRAFKELAPDMIWADLDDLTPLI